MYEKSDSPHADAGPPRRALTSFVIHKPRGERPGALCFPRARLRTSIREHTMIDHRKLGRELELFGSDPLIGAGLPLWLPAGAAARHAVESYIRESERQ